MNAKRLRRALQTLIAALLAAVPAQARHHHASADAGGFDYYLLSLSLAPSFCALSPANQAKSECQTLTKAEYRQTPLTVHGLWPNRARVSVNRQPENCDGPPLSDLPQPLRNDLRRYMPGGPGLQRYEWRKHGTCSGLPPETYFAAVVSLAQHADATIGATLREHELLGQRMRITDLLAAVTTIEPALGPAIVVDCKQPRGGGDMLVDEIRVVLSKDFRPIPATSVGLGQNSGCPRGEGLVPDGPAR